MILYLRRYASTNIPQFVSVVTLETMKTLIVIGFICISTYKVACSSSSESNQEIISEEDKGDAVPRSSRTVEITKFKEWQQRFRKNYRNAAEEQAAMEQILKRIEKIDAHNRLYMLGLVSFKLALWENSDMADDQKKNNLLGLEVPPELRSDSAQENSPRNLPLAPESVNWTEAGLVGPVDNQGEF